MVQEKSQKTRINGILAAIYRQELDKFEDGTNTKFLDLVGHRLLTENVTDTDFLSYKKKIKEDLVYDKITTNLQEALDHDSFGNGETRERLVFNARQVINTDIPIKTLERYVSELKKAEIIEYRDKGYHLRSDK